MNAPLPESQDPIPSDEDEKADANDCVVPVGQVMIGGYQGPMSRKAAAAFASGRVEIAQPGSRGVSRMSERTVLLGALAMGFLLLLGLGGAFVWLRLRGGASATNPPSSGSSVPAAIGHHEAADPPPSGSVETGH